MRPIHAIVLLLVLAALVGGLWLLLGQGAGGSRAAGPVPLELLPGGEEDAPAGVLARPEALAGGATSEEAAGRSIAAEPAASAAGAGDAADAPALTGRVVDAFGRPVAAARVFAADGARGGFMPAIDTIDPETMPFIQRVEGESGPDGRFALGRAPGRGALRVAVRAPGFAPLRVVRELSAQAPADLGDLVLEASVVLSGKVVDSAGRAVAGAELFGLPLDAPGLVVLVVGGGGGRLSTTDASGAFRIDELAAGPYRLQVRHPEHPDRDVEGATEEPGEVLGGLLITLADGFRISGSVAGLQGRDPAAYLVRASAASGGKNELFGPFGEERQGALAADGAFVLRGLRGERDYTLSVVEAGAGGGRFGNERSAPVVARAGSDGVLLTLRSGLTLTFRAVDAKSGAPVTRYEVEAGGGWRQRLDGADGLPFSEHPDGLFRHEGVELTGGADTLEVRVSSEHHATWTRADVPVPPGGVVDLGTITLQPVPVVTVRVVDAAGGEPIAGARVALAGVGDPERSFPGLRRARARIGRGDQGGESTRGRTDANGLAELKSLPGELCILRATHESYADYESAPIQLPALGGASEEVRMLRGGTVVVLAVDAGGRPVADVAIEHEAPGEEGALRWGGGGERTDADGRAVYERLAPGRHRFKVSEADQGGGVLVETVVVLPGGASTLQPGWEEVGVSEGEQSEITLVVPPRGGLRGIVTENGRPLVGASLTLSPARADDERGGAQLLRLRGFGLGSDPTKTDGEGRYRIEDQKVGDYVLSVTHPTRAMPSEFEVSIDEGLGEFNPALEIAVVEGRVLDESGRPVSGARVRVERAGADAGPQRAQRAGLMAISRGGGQVSISSGPADSSTTTDADGRYRLRGVLPGVDLRVRAEAADLQPAASAPFQVRPDQTRGGTDLRLVHGGGLNLRVLRADGQPASFCDVRISFEGELAEGEEKVEDRRQFVQQGGAVAFDGLRPGPWLVSVRSVAFDGGSPAPDPAPRRVAVVAREVLELEMRLP